MDKVREKVNSLTEDFENELYYNKEDIINEYSYDLGIEKGLEQGKKEQTLEIAKSMLNDNKDISEIMKYTGLTKEEIEDLKNN